MEPQSLWVATPPQSASNGKICIDSRGMHVRHHVAERGRCVGPRGYAVGFFQSQPTKAIWANPNLWAELLSNAHKTEDPSARYLVTLGRAGHLESTCQGFAYRGNCKHVREVRGKIFDE